MNFIRRIQFGVTLATLLSLASCHSHDGFLADGGDYLPFSQQIEGPVEASYCDVDGLPPEALPPPPSVRRYEDYEKRLLTLDEAIEIALANSQVIRDVGGLVVSAPASAATIYDPAIQEADPRFGVEAALSAFDAQFGMSLFHGQIDRAFNNAFLASSGSLTRTSDFRLGIDKVAATGTLFTLENLTTYSNNQNFDPSVPPDQQFNTFASVYDTTLQASFRHPVLQGGGVDFNRIAGPNATPGNYSGVMLARIDSDISIADFEAAVRNLVRDVEQTYWELYFVYRDFEARNSGRALALESWDLESRRAEAGIRTPDQEAFAREQYYLAQVAVENAISGLRNGPGGVFTVERQLRILLGLPTSDGTLLVPADEPATVDIQFDWHESLAYALTRRVELRRQQWEIARRELELVAARNFEKMRVDFVGQYRWRGFGDELFGEEFRPAGSAFASLFRGNLQDWTLGIEIASPVGNRIGHAAVRHAELQLARGRALYDEIERQVAHEVRGAFTELDRAYVVSRSNFNRRVATTIRLEAERQRNEKGQTDLDLVLDAQRQAVSAESDYFRAVVDYNLAMMNVHFSRGTLLDRHAVRLAEGAWSDDAHRSAAKLARRYREKMNYCFVNPAPVSYGSFPQRTFYDEPEPLPPVEEPTPAVPDVIIERLPES